MNGDRWRITPGAARSGLLIARSPDDPAVQADRQHLGRGRALAVERVEAVPEVFEKERGYLRIFSDVLQRGVNLGVFNIVNTRVAESFLPLMCSAWALKRWNLKGASKSEYIETLTQFVLQGIGATSRSDFKHEASTRNGRQRKRARRTSP